MRGPRPSPLDDTAAGSPPLAANRGGTFLNTSSRTAVTSYAATHQQPRSSFSGTWLSQAGRDLNPQPLVLETSALPLSYAGNDFALQTILLHALARTRTVTPCGTTPSRWRVYQFHHQGPTNHTTHQRRPAIREPESQNSNLSPLAVQHGSDGARTRDLSSDSRVL